nr:uncharacterized protein LOC107440000 [Parasteatoda tepidariorum]
MMNSKKLEIDPQVQQLLNLLMKSENAVTDHFSQYDEEKKIRIYLKILIAIKNAIEANEEVKFQRLSTSLSLLSKGASSPNLNSSFNCDDNPFKMSNVIIMTCKYNRLEILNHIFSEDSMIISDLSSKIGREYPLPADNDEEDHNAFYYAIRSGNIRLLEVLMKKWPSDYFSSHTEELCSLLSRSLNELNLKNVDVSIEMEMFINSFLLDYYLEKNPPSDSNVYSHDDIEEKLSLILEYIDLFRTKSEFKDLMIFSAKQLAVNIMILKKRLKSTYDRIPWEEMELHLVSIIRYLNNQGSYINCCVTMADFVKYLGIFSQCILNETKEIEQVDIKKLCELPEKLKRGDVVSRITSKYPDFKEFYQNYDLIRDYESLNIIKKYVDIVTEVNSQEKSGKTVIVRALQVIGENLKNSLESPKLSSASNDFLMLFMPNQTNTILKTLRDSFSHGFPLSTCQEIEEVFGSDFYSLVQNDVKSLIHGITSVLQKIKFKTLRTLLERICNCEDIDSFKDISCMIRLINLKDDLTDINNAIAGNNDIITVEKLVSGLNEIMKEKTPIEESNFKKIADIINFEKGKLKNFGIKFDTTLALLIYARVPECKMDSFFISERKKFIRQKLNYVNPDNMSRSLTRIGILAHEIARNAKVDEQNIFNFYSIIFKIFYITECQGHEIKHLKKLKKSYEKTVKITNEKIRSIKKSSTTCYQDILYDDIIALKKIVSDHNFSEKNVVSFQLYQNNKKVQVEIEMLIMSILSSLEHSNLYLIASQLSNEEDNPLLVGRYLRNYLAHGNPVVDILMDSTQLIFLYALKIIKHDIYRKENFMIKRLKTILKAKSIVENQERLFGALTRNSTDDVIHWITEGADIYGRDHDLMTSLHFASKSSNIDNIKLLIGRGLNPKVKDFYDRNILHVAAAGCKEMASYIIEELRISVDEKCKGDQTALHIAAENGCVDVVKTLLQNKTAVNIKSLLPRTPLHNAVINNKVNVVELFLENMEDINLIRNPEGFNLLHFSAEMGHLDMTFYLLQKGAYVNSASDRLLSPLHLSSYAGHTEIVKTLLSKGANVNAKDSFNYTPLHFAAVNGHASTAEVLIAYGADIYSSGHEDLLPLHLAIVKGHISVINTFVKHGVSIKDVTIRGASVLEYAIPHTNLDLINFLIDNDAPVNVKDVNGRNLLHLSIKHGSIDLLLRLIERGVDINAVDKNGFTPLSLSIGLGYFDMAKKLLSKKADIDSVDKRRQNLLHMCATNLEYWNSVSSGYNLINEEKHNVSFPNSSGLEVFKILVNLGINIEMKNIYGHTPLHIACMFNNLPIVQYLTDNSANLNIPDKIGFSPLHYAVDSNNLELVKILFASGKCSLNSMTSEGDTALCLASKSNYAEITEFLIKNKADVNDGDPLYKALVQGSQDTCIILLQNKFIDIEKQFKDKGETLLQTASLKGLERLVSCFLDKKRLSKSVNINESLFSAIQYGYVDIVILLLNHGADVNIVFENHITPLLLAASLGHSKIMQVLLDRGADFNKLDLEGRSSIELAIMHGHLDSVKLFLQNETVDVNEKINGDYTLLHIAVQCGNLDVVKFLMNENASLNVANEIGSKPVHVAVQAGHLHIVKHFLQCDEKLLTERGCSNNTLLHYAAQAGETEIAKYLIEKGADVNESGDDGVRPIHLASKFGFEEVLKVLLNNGAIYDCNLDAFPMTPLLFTHKEGVRKILMLTKEIFDSVKSNNVTKVKSLIDKGACINAKDSGNATLLHYAAWKGLVDIIQILLQNKANPNIVGKNNSTPLHYASKSGNIKVVKILLENGATYNAMSTAGKTPLDLASSKDIIDLLKLIDTSFKNVQNRNTQVLGVLEKFKKSEELRSVVCAKNTEGKTLIAWAIYNDFPDLNQLKRIFLNESESYRQIFNQLFRNEDCDAALNIQSNLQQKNSEMFGLDNPFTLETKEISAIILYKQQKYLQALAIFQEMLQKKKKLFGLNNSGTQKTRFYIGSILHSLGKSIEAINILEDVYSQQSKLLGFDHFETLITLCSLPEVLNALKRHDDALNKNNIAFKKFLEMFGSDNPITIHSQENLANTLTHLGKYEEALSNYKCVYEYKKRGLGHHHSATLMSLHNIKYTSCLHNLSDKTLNDLREVLHIQEKVLGPKHEFTLKAETNLGALLFRSGKISEGFKILKENIEKQRAVFGVNNPKVLKMEQFLEKMNHGVDLFNLRKPSNHTKPDQDPSSNESLAKDLYQYRTFDSEGRTFIHFAASEGQMSLINDALQNGCNVMHTTHKGNTALHIASSKGHFEIAEKLLMHAKENNFDQLSSFINAKTTTGGNSALHAAGNVETVKILLKYGAIYNMRNKEGKTPKDYTKVKEISDFLQLIDEFFTGASVGDCKIISKLKSLGPEEKLAVSNAKTEENLTLLQVGVTNGDRKFIKEIEICFKI